MRKLTGIRRWTLLLAGAACVAACITVPAKAAEPKAIVNYEGVLRDPNGVPRDGDFDMVFRFFNVIALGKEYLVDSHLAAGTGAVTVTGGLFNVKLGGGVVTDGSAVLPGDPYTSLAQVFRDLPSAWLEIQVDGETLAPRIEVVSSAYALNADHLDGKDAVDFIDTSAIPQAKAGDLTVGSLQMGGNLDVGGQVTIQSGAPATGRVLTSGATGTATWQDLPAVQINTLNALSDRLQTSDPSELPFATLRSFDCSGGKTAELIFVIGASSQGSVTGFVGGGPISDTFEYLVAVERNDTLLNTESLIGQDGQVMLLRDGALTFFSGMVTEAGLAGWDGSTATYVFRLEPHLSIMARNSGYATYLQLKISNIISNLMGDAGLTTAVLDDTGLVHEYVVRYEETPLNFLNRIAEGEGVHYHFREAGSTERPAFLTSNSGFTSIPGSFNYHGDLQDPGTGEEFIATFHSRTRQFSGNALAGGWDYLAKEAVTAAATAGGGAGELQEIFADVNSTDIAQVRADAIVAREQVRRYEHSGTGSVAYLKAGHTFTLTDLTTAGFGGPYVVTDIRHYAVSVPAQSCVSYGNAFTAIPSTVEYGSPRRSHPPKASGPVRAIVTNIDDPERLGRIKAKLFPDPNNFVETGWARIAVPSWRQDTRMFIPDVDDEVLVDFVRNDPMVPVVIGGLYNGEQRPTNLGITGSPGANEIFMVNYGIKNSPASRSCYDDLDPNQTQECGQSINFWDDEDPRGETLSWEDIPDRFELTNDLFLEGQLTLGGGAIMLKESGPDASQSLYFFDGGSPVGESFEWDDAADSFQLTNDLKMDGALEASGQLKGGSLDVGTGMIQGGGLSVGSGNITAGIVLATGIVQGATVNATGALLAGSTLTLPGPITLNGTDISQAGGLFTFGGNVAVTGDADLTGDLLVGGGDIRGTALDVSGTSQVRLMGGTVSISSVSLDVLSNNGITSMIDARDTSNAMSVGWYHDGSLANADKLADLNETGDLSVRGSLTPFVSFDIAESFLAGDSVEAGDLVRLDPAVPGAVRLTEGEGDALVIGVVSGKPGIVLGGGSFDEAALRSAWGDDVGSLFGEERARLREAVLAEHDDLRVALEKLDPEFGAEDSLRETAPGVVVQGTDESGPAIDSGTGDGTTGGDAVGRERDHGDDVLALDDGRSGDSATEARAATRRAVEARIEAKSLEHFYRERFAPVALAGRVPVKVDASYGAIEPGDDLAPSPVPGVAMKAAGPGPVIGMALEGLGAGRGKVLVFVSRGRTMAPSGTDATAANRLDKDREPAEAVRISGIGDLDRPMGALAADLSSRPAPMTPSVESRVPFTLRATDGGGHPSGPELLRVDSRGNLHTRGAILPASMDLAEYFLLSEPAEPGDVLAVDTANPGRYLLARKAGDPAVVGVVSTRPGVLLGGGIDRITESDERLAEELNEARALGDEEREEALWSRLRERFEESHAPVALAGTVLCKVDAAYGSIVAGDLLIASSTPGHAQRAAHPAPGTVIGKALESLENGTGRIRILVMTR